jgi:hypothetical protein
MTKRKSIFGPGEKQAFVQAHIRNEVKKRLKESGDVCLTISAYDLRKLVEPNMPAGISLSTIEVQNAIVKDVTLDKMAVVTGKGGVAQICLYYQDIQLIIDMILDAKKNIEINKEARRSGKVVPLRRAV